MRSLGGLKCFTQSWLCPQATSCYREPAHTPELRGLQGQGPCRSQLRAGILVLGAVEVFFVSAGLSRAQQPGELPGREAGSCRQCREEEPWPGAPGAAVGWRLLCYATKTEIFPMVLQTFSPYLPVWGFFSAHLISEGFLSFYTLEDDTGSEL